MKKKQKINNGISEDEFLDDSELKLYKILLKFLIKSSQKLDLKNTRDLMDILDSIQKDITPLIKPPTEIPSIKKVN